MSKNFLKYPIALIAAWLCTIGVCMGQEVPIVDYGINDNGQVQITVNSTAEHYYILKAKLSPSDNNEYLVSMTLGEEGTTVISEPLEALPSDLYQVFQYEKSSPNDSDHDGIDDITEFENRPYQNPLNPAAEIPIIDGLTTIDSLNTFNHLSVKHEVVQWSEYLNGKEFVKFIIIDFQSDSPRVYFTNTNTHRLHADFSAVYDIDYLGDHIRKGHIMFHPTVPSNNGSLGNYAFNFSNAESMDFATVERTHELLGASMPLIENNLSYFIHVDNNGDYDSEIELYNDSRVPVLFESDVYAEVDYWGLHEAEGYGYFRHMTLGDTPNPRDIVLYDALPNSLPRVGGIITSVIQTPLSHVNLRAIQNDIPNAFIRNPLANEEISSLLNGYVYFRVDQDGYILRKASLEEVNEWYEQTRPAEEQEPPLNLNYQRILPLEDIGFDMYDGFGAKCANVAVMGTFDFPEGTIPQGFGVPFYFYQQFMEYNGFFDDVTEMISDSDFKSDREVRDEYLKELRNKIKDASMPSWMMNALSEMHAKFPEGTSVRCRSSTNNEDLPGFSGAGLYDSKTQHPHEGHMSKSIKQVYASLWNLKAFEERDFYRVNHFTASMGVLCHPNYSEEKVNGVGVSADPLYGTSNTYYLNSQLGENLITNPEGNETPEEILLRLNPNSPDWYTLVQRSSLISNENLLMEEPYLEQMKEYLYVIHDEFSWLYEAQGNASFAMDIEYKITSEDQLIIKQARPWVEYQAIPNAHVPGFEKPEQMQVFPNPAQSAINIRCDACQLKTISITNIVGEIIKEIYWPEESIALYINLNGLAKGTYIIHGESDSDGFSTKFVKF